MLIRLKSLEKIQKKPKYPRGNTRGFLIVKHKAKMLENPKGKKETQI